MKYTFHSAIDLEKKCKKYKTSLLDMCLKKEQELSNKSAKEVKKILLSRLKVMKKSINKGLEKERITMGEMGGADAFFLQNYLKKNGIKSLTMSEIALKAGMYAIANNENNACMGCIVACPTAGASGVIPGVFFACQEEYNWTEDKLIEGFIVALGIGSIIAENATISGAEGGCQAEIGSSVAMAAAGLTYMRGGSLKECINAASLGLKNLLGLACDPIGGMVEVPCIKRNAFAVQYALYASDLALMGIESYVPLDEVIDALKNIGNMMSTKIRETALGGLAITKTAQNTCKKLGIEILSTD